MGPSRPTFARFPKRDDALASQPELVSEVALAQLQNLPEVANVAWREVRRPFHSLYLLYGCLRARLGYL